MNSNPFYSGLMDDDDNPLSILMFATTQCSAREVERTLVGVSSIESARAVINRTDPKTGITPLIGACMRHDEDEAIRVISVLLKHGAGIDTVDTTGCFPVHIAAQEGKTKILPFLLDKGAKFDRAPFRKTTTPIWIAAHNGHAECVALLLKAAMVTNTDILERTNNAGKTPAYTTIEICRPAALGVLAKAGADLRRCTPCFYSEEWNDAIHCSDIDNDSFPMHYALDMTVQSFKHLICLGCNKGQGEASVNLQKCGKCKMANFCGKECQLKCWPSHKKVCGKISKGAALIGDPSGPIPEPKKEAFGFEEEFTDKDNEIDIPEDYDLENHPVWEYLAGTRGHPVWRRYPPRIEQSCESMLGFGFEAPYFSYRPGAPECDGFSERNRSLPTPPPRVATRHITFLQNMTEREVYTGASRPVRRNGKREQRVRR